MSQGEGHEVVVLFRDGRYLEAAEVLKACAGRTPEYRNLHNRSAAYYKAGRFERASELAREALRLRPQAVRTHYLLGLILRDAGRLEEAVRALERTCELDRSLVNAVYALAVSRFLLGRVDEAIDEMRRAMALGSEDSLSCFNLGVMLVSKGRWKEAVEMFVRAMKLDPTTCDEYARFLVDIGRAQVYEEVYGQGHRLKNMVGVLGDRFRELSANVSSRLSAGERGELSDIGGKLGAVFSDLNTFLSTARHRQLELDLVDVRELVEQVLVACSSNLSGVTVRRRFSRELPEVVCDSAGIREVLLNLILNASEAMVDGGELRLSVRGRDDAVELRVSDSGPGIPEELVETVFRFGFSTKPFGSGLGLSQARRTVERHGGTLTLESEEGVGTTVCMRLPMSPVVENGIEDLTLRSVLAEDLRDLLAETLEDEGLLLV